MDSGAPDRVSLWLKECQSQMDKIAKEHDSDRRLILERNAELQKRNAELEKEVEKWRSMSTDLQKKLLKLEQSIISPPIPLAATKKLQALSPSLSSSSSRIPSPPPVASSLMPSAHAKLISDPNLIENEDKQEQILSSSKHRKNNAQVFEVPSSPEPPAVSIAPTPPKKSKAASFIDLSGSEPSSSGSSPSSSSSSASTPNSPPSHSSAFKRVSPVSHQPEPLELVPPASGKRALLNAPPINPQMEGNHTLEQYLAPREVLQESFEREQWTEKPKHYSKSKSDIRKLLPPKAAAATSSASSSAASSSHPQPPRSGSPISVPSSTSIFSPASPAQKKSFSFSSKNKSEAPAPVLQPKNISSPMSSSSSSSAASKSIFSSSSSSSSSSSRSTSPITAPIYVIEVDSEAEDEADQQQQPVSVEAPKKKFSKQQKSEPQFGMLGLPRLSNAPKEKEKASPLSSTTEENPDNPWPFPHVDPKANEPSYRYKEPNPRTKKRRAEEMEGITCPDCAKFYEEFKDDLKNPDILQECSRHRVRKGYLDEVSNTPPGFWDWDMSSSLESQSADGAPSSVAARRRPQAQSSKSVPEEDENDDLDMDDDLTDNEEDRQPPPPRSDSRNGKANQASPSSGSFEF